MSSMLNRCAISTENKTLNIRHNIKNTIFELQTDKILSDKILIVRAHTYQSIPPEIYNI